MPLLLSMLCPEQIISEAGAVQCKEQRGYKQFSVKAHAS
jgi:hypothetical protein